MNDPYKVLGALPSASDEELKKAYRELAKKYHPDNYVGNPLADLAAQKMQEINEAYDKITTMRRSSSSQAGSYSSAAAGNTAANHQQGYRYSQFNDVRHLINSNRIFEAEEILNGIPQSKRDAEWFFLKGNIFYSRGWLDEAYNYIARAVQMEPGNAEYLTAFNKMQSQRQHGSPYGYARTNSSCSSELCNLCTSIICLSMCCS